MNLDFPWDKIFIHIFTSQTLEVVKSEICPRSKTPVELWFGLTVAQWSGSNVAVDITYLVLVCSTALIIRNGVIWKRQSVSVSIKDIKALYPNFFIRHFPSQNHYCKNVLLLDFGSRIFLGDLLFAPIQRKGNDVHFLRLFLGPGCDETQMHQIPYGMAKKHEKGAVYQFECEEGAVLSGSPTVYCDGYKWNDTAPTCLSKYFF